jgi:hypothetical protein
LGVANFARRADVEPLSEHGVHASVLGGLLKAEASQGAPSRLAGNRRSDAPSMTTAVISGLSALMAAKGGRLRGGRPKARETKKRIATSSCSLVSLLDANEPAPGSTHYGIASRRWATSR